MFQQHKRVANKGKQYTFWFSLRLTFAFHVDFLNYFIGIIFWWLFNTQKQRDHARWFCHARCNTSSHVPPYKKKLMEQAMSKAQHIQPPPNHFFVIINLFYVIIMIANYHVTYIEILEVFTMSKWSTQNCIARMELGYIWAMWTLCWHSNNPCHFILFEIVSPYKIAFSFLNSQILPDFDITIYIRQTWWELSLCREYFLK
jgi:hypothetical protein